MFFLIRIFWSSFINTPNIDEILKKATSIDEILEEDNIVNSIKQQGSKFADFLMKKPDYFMQLIDYVILE